MQTALFDGSLLFVDSTIHLWFMYNLIFYYAVALALVPWSSVYRPLGATASSGL